MFTRRSPAGAGPFTLCEGICNTSSETRCDTEILHAAGRVGLERKYQECNSFDVSGVAREISPSEGGRDGTSLNVGNDIVVEKPKHSGLGPHNAREVVCRNPLGEMFELRNSPPDVFHDTISRIERAKINSNHRDPTVPASRWRKVSLRK